MIPDAENAYTSPFSFPVYMYNWEFSILIDGDEFISNPVLISNNNWPLASIP